MSYPTATPITASQLWFTQVRQVEILPQMLSPAAGEVLVQTSCSAVSAGTELLVYRGQLPDNLALDATIASLQQAPQYPLQYGYAAVGKVTHIGDGVDAQWMGKRVFSFAPHASHFVSQPQDLIPIPDDIDDEAAIFLANMETAVNLVQDGKPALAERVVVLGQGIVGLLLTAVLARFPLKQLLAVDKVPERRALAQQLGAHLALDPDAAAQKQKSEFVDGADLIYEVSGVPQALNLAIDLSGFASRLVIGSWYGNKSAPIVLGGAAHRNRLQIITSQVSSIAPELSGRWNKARRFDVAWQLIRDLQPQRLISHRLKITEAAGLYERLDKQLGEAPQAIVQAVFVYPS